MPLTLNPQLAQHYRSPSQKIRVMSEAWLAQYGYCPVCGASRIKALPPNTPVGDFYCADCQEQFELKSQKAPLKANIVNGAYATMIKRIQAQNNPHLLLLAYQPTWQVLQLRLIPKHFFTLDLITARPPLPDSAKRAGWVGCTISLQKLPSHGKLDIIQAGKW